MTEFYIAFIWGLGVSCGAAIGLLAFMVAKVAFEWATGRLDKYEKLLLTERNALTVKTIECLVRIAGATEDYAMWSRYGPEVMPRDWNNRGDAESKDGGE